MNRLAPQDLISLAGSYRSYNFLSSVGQFTCQSNWLRASVGGFLSGVNEWQRKVDTVICAENKSAVEINILLRMKTQW